MQENSEKLINELNEAIKNGEEQKVILLLGNIDISKIPSSCTNPLAVAVHWGYLSILQLLLKNGAKTSIDSEHNLLHWSLRNKKMLAFLDDHYDEINFQDGTTREHIKAAQGDLAYFKKHPEGINALLIPNEYGITPFYFLALILKNIREEERKPFLDHFALNSPVKVNEAVWRQPEKTTQSTKTLYWSFVNAIESFCKEGFPKDDEKPNNIASLKSWWLAYPASKETFIDAIIKLQIVMDVDFIAWRPIDTCLMELGYLLISSGNEFELITKIHQHVFHEIEKLKKTNSEEYDKNIDNLHRYFAACHAPWTTKTYPTTEEEIRSLEQAINCYSQIKKISAEDVNTIDVYKSKLAAAVKKSGDKFFEAKNWLTAIDAYQRALKINDETIQGDDEINNRDSILNDLSISFDNLGRELQKSKKWLEAASAFEQALIFNNQRSDEIYNPEERKDDNGIIYKEIAKAYTEFGNESQNQKNWEIAIQAYHKAIAAGQQTNVDMDSKYRCLAYTLGHYNIELKSKFSFSKLSDNLEPAIAAIGNIRHKVAGDYQCLASMYREMPGSLAKAGSHIFSQINVDFTLIINKLAKAWITIVREKHSVRPLLFILDIIINDYRKADFPHNSFKAALMLDQEKVENLKGLANEARQLLNKDESLSNTIFKKSFLLQLNQRVGATEHKLAFVEQNLSSVKRPAPLTDRSSPINAGSVPPPNSINNDDDDVTYEGSTKKSRTDKKL